jgi:hypothetical protein
MNGLPLGAGGWLVLRGSLPFRGTLVPIRWGDNAHRLVPYGPLGHIGKPGHNIDSPDDGRIQLPKAMADKADQVFTPEVGGIFWVKGKLKFHQ